MSDKNIKKEDLFNVIKNGHNWNSKKIEDELKILTTQVPFSISQNHSLRFDRNDKFHYIYDNDCYLFIFDGKIELRCDRDNVFSSYQTIEYPIKSKEDIKLVYDNFVSMTMEDEEEQ
ncbi:hypothetical protein A9236_02945 [Polynucleobacter sp. QLW-P1DATA-2]|jgi:hypothetical protein|uniref:hypothetical protein n=1 Tax=Polynucleobacter sp. QLW-P1DATA-2 TaxID=1743167 RepID=UPI0008F8C047|nr:hypothetical protein [Polynucleobacter sp. QLW-P1DATA-2]MBT8596160.1 hypothetical protein [Polynucleobacter paneuropaeus]OIN00255.1 hypothetical protein A9236_02945 [Polynucleobacter sp. QLW-P1DATA-2]